LSIPLTILRLARETKPAEEGVEAPEPGVDSAPRPAAPRPGVDRCAADRAPARRGLTEVVGLVELVRSEMVRFGVAVLANCGDVDEGEAEGRSRSVVRS
jgi:hypothetical protein